MHTLTRQQAVLLVLITLVWGFNWPIMKFGVTGFPPLTFRAISMGIGLPVLGLFLWWRSVPLRIGRGHWPELARLTVFNMLIWHTLMILAIPTLSSGRAAILGYTMPVFSAVLGGWWFGQRLTGRAWVGVAAAGAGVALLLWHELTNMAGSPVGVVMMLAAAASWAVGTQMLRHTSMPQPTLAIAFWLTAVTTVWMAALALLFEREVWGWPGAGVWGAIVYNALGIFAFAQVVWLALARDLPPIASTLSVMFIPVLSVFSGAWWLGEVLHWQDWAAVLLVLVAIAAVLWPRRSPPSGR
ncbi:DMT family transporter [Hydrogenophaga sp. BPS33]|uniref:DMT family transporter n=1 Tax=Hydrogenophaga sp. BPS33 TaxID=2651974 RepID=UPI00132040FA|nr:EamA family transporter [Hydrogenophaga sp. BPS33]QHE88308.1 EamA family transporter [Hydrogenophaga sp. BPS33]